VSRVGGFASSPAISADGDTVAFVAGRTGGSAQVYLRDLRQRRTVRVSAPRAGIALGPVVSASGRFVAYTAIARDGRSAVMVRDMRRPAAIVVSRATGPRGALADGDAADPSISADGRLVAFSSTATNLAAGKPDDRRGVFVRDLRRATTRLESTAVLTSDRLPAPPLADAPPALKLPAALGPHQVVIVDNAFHQGRDRPVVRLSAGQRLTWLWRSRESHEVTVADGPQQVRSSTQTHGRFSARLTVPGTYRFVCAIHAPGMRMTAIVR
jgi:plastocyanin